MRRYYLYAGFIFLVLISVSPFLNKYSTRTQNDMPSRTPSEHCKWEKISGAGIELWGQNCDLGGRKIHIGISETLPGAFVEEITKDGPVAVDDAIQIFELKNQSINSIIPLLEDYQDWEESDKCTFIKLDTYRSDLIRYKLMPTGDALKKFKIDEKKKPITSTCAGYGMGNSGVKYFEIHSSNPNRVLFIKVGKEHPLFDENTILVR